MAGARLTDGNANIADLSDENRPTKLAEQYSELYDNEWTDAFEVLTAGEHVSEQDACHTLLEALCAIYDACKKKANGDWENMREAMKTFLGGKEPPSELMKPLKDQRKKIHDGHLKHLKRDLKENIHKLFPDKKKRHDVRLKLFLNKGIELCWLMVIQDPSVYLDVTICNRNGEKYESITLKPYTQSGQYIDYIVWPPLYLNEGGNILCKGIAQCKPEVTNRISCDERAPTSEQQEITRATKTETGLQESVKKTKSSETKLEGAALLVSDSYHNDRYTEPGTCSDQKESNNSKLISVEILSDTKNANRTDLTSLHDEENKRDTETNITTETERDTQEKMGANFDTKSNHCNESNSNNIPTNAKASKRKSSIATRSMEDDRNTRVLHPNTSTTVGSSKCQNTMETSDPGFKNNESTPIVKNTNDKSKQYSLTHPQTGRKKKKKGKQELNISVGKAT